MEAIKGGKSMKKKHILVAGLLAVCGFCIFGTTVKAMNNQVVYAEEEEVIESESEEEVVVESEEQPEIVFVDNTEAVEETTNKFKEIWETYLLPAILSINVGAVVAVISAIFNAYRNHKSRKYYNDEIVKVVGVVLEMSKQMGVYIAMLAERNEKVQNLLNSLEANYELTEKQLALFNEQKKEYENLKNAVVALMNIETELAKSNPEFIKNGVAKQIVDLKTQLLEIIK